MKCHQDAPVGKTSQKPQKSTVQRKVVEKQPTKLNLTNPENKPPPPTTTNHTLQTQKQTITNKLTTTCNIHTSKPNTKTHDRDPHKAQSHHDRLLKTSTDATPRRD